MLVEKTANATFLFVISFAELFTHVLAILQYEERDAFPCPQPVQIIAK